jgi:drug/metabolite transporter (DMT)-like permease
LSARVVRAGLNRLTSPDNVVPILVGMLVSLGVGCVVLFAILGGKISFSTFSWWTFAAGVLLFPVGTGLYYLCGDAFSKRMEFASQFSSVKPLFSVLLAALVLGETLTPRTFVSLGFIAAGILLMMLAVRRGTVTPTALALGLLLAASWGGGEVMARMGLAGESPSMQSTFWALASGTVVAAVATIPLLLLRRGSIGNPRAWAGPFMLHGVISFAVAYGLMFESIKRIGVGPTALITAFWPSLTILHSLFTRQRSPILMLMAALLLLIGSLVSASAIFRH